MGLSAPELDMCVKCARVRPPLLCRPAIVETVHGTTLRQYKAAQTHKCAEAFPNFWIYYFLLPSFICPSENNSSLGKKALMTWDYETACLYQKWQMAPVRPCIRLFAGTGRVPKTLLAYCAKIFLNMVGQCVSWSWKTSFQIGPRYFCSCPCNWKGALSNLKSQSATALVMRCSSTLLCGLRKCRVRTSTPRALAFRDSYPPGNGRAALATIWAVRFGKNGLCQLLQCFCYRAFATFCYGTEYDLIICFMILRLRSNVRGGGCGWRAEGGMVEGMRRWCQDGIWVF